MSRLSPALVLIPVAILAAVAAFAHARHRPPVHSGPLVMVASKTGFKLSGAPITGLYPGATKPLKVKIKNPYGFTVKIKTPKTKVTTTRAGCSGAATNLKVVRPKITLRIPAHRSKTMTLQVVMPGTVANACQGARFSISLKAKATKS